MNIRVLPPKEAYAVLTQLSEMILQAVEDGASIDFLIDCTHADILSFWQKQARRIAEGRLALLAALQGDDLVGTVSLCLDTPPNQPHRAAVKTMMVRREMQRRGIGTALLALAETEARQRNRWLLMMETVSGGPADRLFERANWEKVGDVPALYVLPHGGLAPSTLYFKRL